MSFDWIHETPARWDETKERVIGSAPGGIFELSGYSTGDLLPGEWWRVEAAGRPIGYGWMDTTWGDAEILLAVETTEQGGGAGTFILDRLEIEAGARGLNYLFNVVKPTHPNPEVITRWLEKRRFKPDSDGRLLRRAVKGGTSSS